MLNDIYIGVKGSVLRIDRKTGVAVWKTHLKSSKLTTLKVDDELVVAHTSGELFGLRKDNGQILWNNPMTGLGYGHCIIASNEPDTIPAIQDQQDQES